MSGSEDLRSDECEEIHKAKYALTLGGFEFSGLVTMSVWLGDVCEEKHSVSMFNRFDLATFYFSTLVQVLLVLMSVYEFFSEYVN